MATKKIEISITYIEHSHQYNKMTDKYRYIIFNENCASSAYTCGYHIADYNNDHILYNGEQYRSHSNFMRSYTGYGFDKYNFIIKCVDMDDKIIFTTSYKKLKCNLTTCAGKDRIKELYSILEKIKRGEYVKEEEDPLIDKIEKEHDNESNNEDSDEELEPEEIINSIKSTIKIAMKMTSKYKKHLNSSSEIQKYTDIYEQLDTMMKNIKN